jgi:hypothetical protein
MSVTVIVVLSLSPAASLYEEENDAHRFVVFEARAASVPVVADTSSHKTKRRQELGAKQQVAQELSTTAFHGGGFRRERT